MNKVASFPVPENSAKTAQVPEQNIKRETIVEYLKAFGYDKTLSQTEQNQFIQTALSSSLDPFKREIHIAVFGEGENRKLSIITGYQIYLKRAERTGRLDGWRAWLEGEIPHMKAVVEIFRKDWSHSFTHEVYWEEAVQKKKDGTPTQFWAKQPRFQLRKVAMAQAFRLAFPDELGGLPYESSELPESSAEPNASYSPLNGDTDTADLPDPVPEKNVKTSTEGSPAVAEKQTAENTQDGYVEEMTRRIEELFDASPQDFTKRHRAWILDKVQKAADKSAVQKMLAYTEKVIRKSA